MHKLIVGTLISYQTLDMQEPNITYRDRHIEFLQTYFEILASSVLLYLRLLKIDLM
jgi:hypothetical protein